MEIWHIDLMLDRGALRRAFDLLDPQERTRFARLRSAADRRRYAAAHAGLRRLLGHSLRCAPGQIHLALEPGGRPRLRRGVGPGHDLHFSLSHAGDHALVALCHGHPVGVDLELLPAPPDLVQDLNAQLSPAEHDGLARLPSHERPRAALRAWVRKEALLKACGLGLRLPPTALSVSLGAEARIEGSELLPFVEGPWSLVGHERPSEWTAAVAWPGHQEPVRWLAWPRDALGLWQSAAAGTAPSPEPGASPGLP